MTFESPPSVVPSGHHSAGVTSSAHHCSGHTQHPHEERSHDSALAAVGGSGGRKLAVTEEAVQKICGLSRGSWRVICREFESYQTGYASYNGSICGLFRMDVRVITANMRALTANMRIILLCMRVNCPDMLIIISEYAIICVYASSHSQICQLQCYICELTASDI